MHLNFATYVLNFLNPAPGTNLPPTMLHLGQESTHSLRSLPPVAWWDSKQMSGMVQHQSKIGAEDTCVFS